MMSRARLALVLIGALLASASPYPRAAAGAGPAGAPRAAEPAIRWMPQATQLLLRVRFADMRTSALFRTLMTSKPLFSAEMAPIERFAAEARIDLARDVDLGWIGTDGREAGASVAFLTGRLDGAALGPRLAQRGARTSPYGDITLYALPRRAPGRASSASSSAPGSPEAAAGETVVAFSGPGTALVGSRNWVCVALDRAAGRGAGGAMALLPLTGGADTGATIWSAAGGAAVGAKIRSQWTSGQLGGEEFDSIQSLVATFRFASDLTIDSVASAQDEDADMLAMTLRGLVAVSGLRASVSDPSLAEVLKGIRVDRTQGGVRLTTRIPASFASRL